MLLKLAALVLLFPVAVLVPGFVGLRRFRLPDELRLSMSVAVSVAFLYLAGFALYLSNAGAPAVAAIAVAILLAGALHLRELLAFLRSPAVSAVLLHWAIFASWLLLLSLVVRNFSGGGWAGDWQEHYERALVFVGRLPPETRFLGIWSLAARPPLHNLVAALFMRLAGDGFAVYQLTSVLLGTLQFVAAASLWTALAGDGVKRRHAGLLVLAAFLCLNPAVVQNAVYPWTRALTSFFLLQAAALFVVALREGSASARRWSYLLLGLGVATHYSAVPYLLGLAAVELWFMATRRLALREAALAPLLVFAPVAPWLAFAVDRFGVAATFLSNSTVEWNASLGPAGIAARAIGNLVSTLVPHPFRDVPHVWAQDYLPGLARDYAFLVYQVSLPALMGSVGGIVVAGSLAIDAARRLRAGRPEAPALVALFVSIVVILGVGTVAIDDRFGVAHNCLLPLGAGGIVYLALRWRLAPAWLRTALAAGLLVDAALGIGLQVWMIHLALPDLAEIRSRGLSVSQNLVDSLTAKEWMDLVFLGDLPWRSGALLAAAVALVALLTLAATRAAAEARPAVRPG